MLTTTIMTFSLTFPRICGLDCRVLCHVCTAIVFIYLFVIFIARCLLVQMPLVLENMEISPNLTGLKVFIGSNLFAS
jgi:hypothetical protein